ncbi:acetolactate decarboxylase [uncultured Winogradskyella sp.]|uniref:acetolactate decarboxylase n=1 Tax=uncultured Winogradskyella sp. TaxID=395353 RepID=UPI00351591EF
MHRTCFFALFLIIILTWSCQKNKSVKPEQIKVNVVGAMKDAMWKGELFPKVLLDTISDKTGLYGLGPMSFMRGELLVLNGKTYLSYIDSKDSLVVDEKNGLSAPFFVYANASSWDTTAIPNTIKNIKDIETYVASHIKDSIPFLFKLRGSIAKAKIHVQNLPEGTKVSSPKEAHEGQRTFLIKDKDVEIVGFYSKNHQGIFTHHDAYTHMHLITADGKFMGHLDEITLNRMNLLLPKTD